MMRQFIRAGSATKPPSSPLSLHDPAHQWVLTHGCQAVTVQRRRIEAWAVAAIAAAVILTSAGSAPASVDYSWPPCTPGSTCVSSNSFMQPAQYLAPWSYTPGSQETAFRALMDELSARSAELIQVDAGNGYIRARVPLASGGSPDDSDLLQFRLKEDGVVLFKSESAGNRVYPPFCLTPGCISGPGNRQRLEALRNDLGWSVLETDEDKQWVQILLH